MYATLAFAITLLGVFSIFELLKGNQKNIDKNIEKNMLFSRIVGEYKNKN